MRTPFKNRWTWLGGLAVMVCQLLGLSGCACGRPASPATETVATAATGLLVCLGDSITAGEPRQIVGEGNDYVTLLRNKADNGGNGLRVQGQGRSGWTTGDYAKNIDSLVEQMPADATLVTIMLGTNDTRSDAPAAEIASQAVQNLRAVIARYREKAPEAKFVVISAPALYPDIHDEQMRNANYDENGPAEVAALRDAYENMAAEDELGFIDVSDLSSKDKSVEGVHPDAAGHVQLADRIWDGLQSNSQ